MQDLASLHKLDMNSKRDLAAVQRMPEIGIESRMKMKTICQKWYAGLQALTGKHGAVFDSLQNEFMTGSFDTIIFNTTSPSTTAFHWSFVKLHLRGTLAEAAASQAQEFEKIAAEKECKAKSLEESAVEERKDPYGGCVVRSLG